MSRIHDALRRGQQQPAVPRGGHQQRTAQADAVLAALGYRSDLGPDRRPLVFGVVAALTLAAVLSWEYWPASTQAPATRAAHNIPPSPPPIAPVSVPVSGPVGPVNVPAESRSSREDSHAASVVVDPVVAVAPATVAAKSERNHGAADTRATLPATVPPRPVSRSTAAASGPRVTARPPASSAASAAPTSGESPASSDFPLALYYQRTGDFEQALVAYKKLLQHDELNVEAHNNLGMLYQGKGLYEDAAREFQRVLAIDQAYPTAHLNLSAAYLKLGKPDAAAAEARAVLALDPRQSDALVNLALAQDVSGQPGDARLTLRRALEIAPHHAAAHYNLAQQYERAGEPGLAADHYRQFLQYAGPEQSAYVADARGRLQALRSKQ